MSTRWPPIAWWLRSSPSRLKPARSAALIEAAFQGSMYNSTRSTSATVQAKVVNAVRDRAANPCPRAAGAT